MIPWHLTPPEDEIIEKCADSTIVNLGDIPKVISTTWKNTRFRTLFYL